MEKIDLKQLMWGAIIGVITVGAMAITYKVGYDRGMNKSEGSIEENVEEEETATNEKKIDIAIASECEEITTVKETESGKIYSYCSVFEEGKTAFDMLVKLADSSDRFTFDYDRSEFGVFVNSINGLSADDSKEFWAFTINGEMSMVGVVDYEVKEGDVLGFNIEKIEF